MRSWCFGRRNEGQGALPQGISRRQRSPAMSGGSCAIYRRICVGIGSPPSESLCCQGLAGMIVLYLLGIEYPFILSRSSTRCAENGKNWTTDTSHRHFSVRRGFFQAGQGAGCLQGRLNYLALPAREQIVAGLLVRIRTPYDNCACLAGTKNVADARIQLLPMSS